MTKELEALENIKYYVGQVMVRDKGIGNSVLLKSICNFNKECLFIETALKALEIIKEKEVDVGWLKRAKDLQEYNSGMGINSYSALTQEEYDILKEILK